MSERKSLSQEELEQESGEHLPDREAMSIVDLGDASGAMFGAPVPPDDDLPADDSSSDQTYPVKEPPHDPDTPPF